MVELVFESAFNPTLYPVLNEKPEFRAIVEDKLKGMRSFMDKMKGGVRIMRSPVDFEGVRYTVILKI